MVRRCCLVAVWNVVFGAYAAEKEGEMTNKINTQPLCDICYPIGNSMGWRSIGGVEGIDISVDASEADGICEKCQALMRRIEDLIKEDLRNR